MHDPRLGRFFAVDPLAPTYPHNSPYAFSENRLIDSGELEGLEKFYSADGILIDKLGISNDIRVVNYPKELAHIFEKNISIVKNHKVPEKERQEAHQMIFDNSLPAMSSMDDAARLFAWRFASQDEEHGAGIYKLRIQPGKAGKIEKDIYILGPLVKGDGNQVNINESFKGKTYEVLFKNQNQIVHKLTWKLVAIIHNHPPGHKEFSVHNIRGMDSSDAEQSRELRVPIYMAAIHGNANEIMSLWKADFQLPSFREADKKLIDTGYQTINLPEGISSKLASLIKVINNE